MLVQQISQNGAKPQEVGSMTETETNGKALVEHWEWAREKGLMNGNTAGSLKAACSQVLSALGDEADTVDIKTLDVEGTFQRFQNLRKKDFTPESLATYKSRFRKAVESYLKYLEDPAGWKPEARPVRATTERKKTPETNGNGHGAQETVLVTKREMPQSNMVEYPYPVREGQIARLVLPRDLKMSEVKRLTAFMGTLAVDFEG
jgi:hypothetical protein